MVVLTGGLGWLNKQSALLSLFFSGLYLLDQKELHASDITDDMCRGAIILRQLSERHSAYTTGGAITALHVMFVEASQIKFTNHVIFWLSVVRLSAIGCVE